MISNLAPPGLIAHANTTGAQSHYIKARRKSSVLEAELGRACTAWRFLTEFSETNGRQLLPETPVSVPRSKRRFTASNRHPK